MNSKSRAALHWILTSRDHPIKKLHGQQFQAYTTTSAVAAILDEDVKLKVYAMERGRRRCEEIKVCVLQEH